jgi:hypothetical protein
VLKAKIELFINANAAFKHQAFYGTKTNPDTKRVFRWIDTEKVIGFDIAYI